MSKTQLITAIEKHFLKLKLTVSYVNLCYNIEEMVLLNQGIRELVKQKGFYKLHIKKQMKAHNLTKKRVVANPQLIEKPVYKVGILKKKTLNLLDIQQEIRDTEEKMVQYSKNLEPGSERRLFIGVAIVVVKTQKEQSLVVKSQQFGFLETLTCKDATNKSNFDFERAPEPSDVYWENLNVSSSERTFKVALTFIATILVIAACFGVIYGLNVSKKVLNEGDNSDQGLIRALSFICSFVIIIVN